jgi:hypothetical protein
MSSKVIGMCWRPVTDDYYLVDGIGQIDGRRLAPSERIRVAWNAMSPGYFI